MNQVTLMLSIQSDSSENPVLAQKTVQHVLNHFGLENQTLVRKLKPTQIFQ